jgi:hypothetical protein
MAALARRVAGRGRAQDLRAQAQRVQVAGEGDGGDQHDLGREDTPIGALPELVGIAELDQRVRESTCDHQEERG